MNAQEIIEDAFSEIRVKRTGYAPTADEMQLGRRYLNRMLKAWAAIQLLLPYRTRETLALTAGIGTYTIGTGGTLNTTRPLAIDVVKLRLSGEDYDLDMVSLDRLEREVGQTDSRRPTLMAYEPNDPLGRIYFDCLCDQAYTLVMHSTKPFTGFASLTTEEDIPDEYEEPVVANLAVRLAPHWGKEASASTRTMAAQGLAAIRARNVAFRVPTLRVDAALLNHQRFDITQG